MNETRIMYDEDLETLIDDILSKLKQKLVTSKTFTFKIAMDTEDPKADIVFHQPMIYKQVEHIMNSLNLIENDNGVMINTSIIKQGSLYYSITLEVSPNA